MNSQTGTEYICRICGLVFDTPTWLSSNEPSYDICPCCGVEFGFDDTHLDAVVSVRKEWLITNEGKWHRKKYRPSNWSLKEQMKNIPLSWRGDFFPL